MLVQLDAISQVDTLKNIRFNLYGDFYWSPNFSTNQLTEKPNFIYNHKRLKDFSINFLMAKLAYQKEHFRLNVGLMTGNYSTYNLSNEPKWAQSIYEANLAFRLSKKQSLWLQAGIMPSHIGFESAMSEDCWTITRSILAENSPYVETGFKLTYGFTNDKIQLSALYLNGWQQINNPFSWQKPALGTQLYVKPNKKLILNYSTFFGHVSVNSQASFRHFHNLFAQWEPSRQFGMITGFDLGFQEDSSNKSRPWFSPVLILRKSISHQLAYVFRGEYYDDKYWMILGNNFSPSNQITSISNALDYQLTSKIKIRIEGRHFYYQNATNAKKRNDFFLTSNLLIRI